jgi:hypothetical protein
MKGYRMSEEQYRASKAHAEPYANMPAVHVAEDPNCLSYWYPRIPKSVPTPETRILVMPESETWALADLCDGNTPGCWNRFIVELRTLADEIGYPCFLRTGHGSGKHDWERTCYLPDRDTLPQHVADLVEWSQLVDMIGIPHNVWVVRKLLPVEPMFHAFRGMPISRERRLFVVDQRVQCCHPYWPVDAIAAQPPRGCPDWRDRLEADNGTTPRPDELIAHALAVATQDGIRQRDWSMDFLWSGGQWWLTDMALAQRSFHWPGCEHAPK